MKQVAGIVLAVGVAVAVAAGSVGRVVAGDKPPNVHKKAAEWAADCVYATMESGTYEGTAAELGQFCVDAIKVVVNADYDVD